MAGTSLVKAKLRPMSLRSIPAIVPTNKEEKQQLADDLTKMGCEGLLVETLDSEERGANAGVSTPTFQRVGRDN